MNVTPEIVRAEMDYRIERALGGASREHLRAARRVRRGWFQRLREHHDDERPTAANEAPRAA